METQHQMELNNLRKQINQLKADKIEVSFLNISMFIFHVHFVCKAGYRRAESHFIYYHNYPLHFLCTMIPLVLFFIKKKVSSATL